MKRPIALALALVLALSLLTACKGNVDTPSGGDNVTPSSNNSTSADPNGSTGYVFVEGDEDEIIVFNFEDTEHRQAVEAWLKTVLYAEDYYEFIDGEDYDAPFDFDYEEPIWYGEED